MCCVSRLQVGLPSIERQSYYYYCYKFVINLLYILAQSPLHFGLCIVSCLLLCNRVYPLLGTAQGLAVTQQHPFPWYPPVCTGLSDIPESQRSADQLKAVKTRHKLSQKIPDAKMQQVLIRS